MSISPGDTISTYGLAVTSGSVCVCVCVCTQKVECKNQYTFDASNTFPMQEVTINTK